MSSAYLLSLCKAVRGVCCLETADHGLAQYFPLLEWTFLNLTQYLATQTTSLSRISLTDTDIIVIFVCVSHTFSARLKPVRPSESLAEHKD